MVEFFEKTWFIWWIFSSLAILRWFHIISSSRDLEARLDRSGKTSSESRQLSSSRS